MTRAVVVNAQCQKARRMAQFEGYGKAAHYLRVRGWSFEAALYILLKR